MIDSINYFLQYIFCHSDQPAKHTVMFTTKYPFQSYNGMAVMRDAVAIMCNLCTGCKCDICLYIQCVCWLQYITVLTHSYYFVGMVVVLCKQSDNTTLK